MKNLIALCSLALLATASPAAEKLQMIVMDPLSKELACDCVKGYAQRNYKVLAAFLHQKLGIEVKTAHGETLAAALKETGGAADLVIGKSSVVISEAEKNGRRFTPVARLTGKDGSVWQQGLIVVRKEAEAKKLSDLDGWRIIFGPADCEEKSAAPAALLRKAGVSLPKTFETAASCSSAAEMLMKLPSDAKAAAAISSYAEPLLAGCGTIKQGDLRIIGKTKDVPFITAFASQSLPSARAKALTEALLDTGGDLQLLQAIESQIGFIGMDEAVPEKGKTSSAKPWHQFRGPNRDGVAGWLPSSLPKEAKFEWEAPLPSDGIGGIAATDEMVILGCRDALDEADVFFCLDAATGKERWRFQYRAGARDALDYGCSPRATPLIADGRVFLFGAFGHLHCVDAASGDLVWASNLAEEFGGRRPQWGYAGSPLLADGRLIVQPGGRQASLAALDPATGDLLWESPGRRPGYAAPLAASIHGKPQIIALDDETLGGWDPATGKRLWELAPPAKGDFNVPTPFMIGERLFAVSENNGARLYEFDAAGRIKPQPVAMNDALIPDAHTPVLAGRHIIGHSGDLHCLSSRDLWPVWLCEDDVGGYSSIISDGKSRVLTVSDDGVLHLHDVSSPKEIASLRLAKDSPHLLSHPALVGNRLYLRIGQRAVCLIL